jgi:hypothetical protein
LAFPFRFGEQQGVMLSINGAQISGRPSQQSLTRNVITA